MPALSNPEQRHVEQRPESVSAPWKRFNVASYAAAACSGDKPFGRDRMNMFAGNAVYTALLYLGLERRMKK
jgi:hypothetical protein